jgi:hypothetical protein
MSRGMRHVVIPCDRRTTSPLSSLIINSIHSTHNLTMRLLQPLIARLLCLACLVLLCVYAQETKTTTESASQSMIQVEDYLKNLSVADLKGICTARGFVVAPREDGQPLQKEDFLEGARRCLTLENEMNAILAEHPELAAELDKEVERLRLAKEKLEKEREELLAQKELLEKQLMDAGVDLGNVNVSSVPSASEDKVSAIQSVPAPLTAEEVLKDSFIQLFERVKLDFLFLKKILDPIMIQPSLSAARFIWRYCEPLLGSLVERAKGKIKTIRQAKQNSEKTPSKALQPTL